MNWEFPEVYFGPWTIDMSTNSRYKGFRNNSKLDENFTPRETISGRKEDMWRRKKKWGIFTVVISPSSNISYEIILKW